MNWIDILLIAIVFFSLWAGWRRGFLTGSLELLGWIASVSFGFVFYYYAAKSFEKYVPQLGVWTYPLAFILVIILTRLIISVIINAILSATSLRMHRDPF